MFQTMNSDGSNNQSLKYQRFTPKRVATIMGLENMTLWQRLSSFTLFWLLDYMVIEHYRIYHD